MEEATEFRLVRLEADCDTVSERLCGLTNSLTKVATEFNDLHMEVNRIETVVESIKSRPGDKWDKIVYALISTLAAAIVAYFIGGQG